MTATTTPLEIAVVGHTNVGKTSLLRTLTRQRSFGAVADSPGTTRHVESIDLRIGGTVAVRYYDTPGLEDAAALQQYLKNLPGEGTPVERVRAFLAGPEAHAAFEQEAKVLRTLLAVDAAIYVIDCREEVLPKYRYEIEILSACAKPVMPVLNFLRGGHNHEVQWREVLAAYHLHASVQFDAVAPFTGAERQLYQDLGVLLRARRPQLHAITEDLEVQAQERRHAATQIAASVLVTAAAMRREIDRDAAADAPRKAALVRDFKASLAAHVESGVKALLAVYGFGLHDADLALAPWTHGRWEADLFNPQTLVDAGQKLGTGAAVGAAVGLVADVALAGLSLGAATALGAAVGGLASQGWSQVPRKIANRMRGTEELTLENDVLLFLTGSLLRLCTALEQRGHAALETLNVAPAGGDAGPSPHEDALIALVHILSPARSFPQWERVRNDPAGGDARRSHLVERVAQGLRALVQLSD